MTTSLRKGRQLLALALASTTVVVAAGASAASAASAGTSTNHLYTGSADAVAVDTILTLPNGANAAIPFRNPAELALIRSTGAVVHTGAADDVATSVADLGSGSLVTTAPLSQVLGPVLTHTVTSTLTTPNPTPFQPGAVPANPLGLTLAVTPLTANTVTATHATSASAAVTNGSLGSLSSISPQLTGGLQTAFTAVNGPLQTAINAVTAALAPAIAAVNTAKAAGAAGTGALGAVTIPGVATPVDLTSLVNSVTDLQTLSDTLSGLPAAIAAVEDKLLNGAALSLDGVSSSESITPVGTTSTGTANVATASLFGGLVQLQATKGTATATANGTAGQGAATSNAAAVTASAGTDLTNLLTLVANAQGITATTSPVAGTGLSAVTGPVNTLLKTLLAQLNSLNAVKIDPGTATHSATADGTHAEAKATPALVSISLPDAPNLVALSLGAVSVVANQENVTTTTKPAVKAAVRTPRKVAKPVAPTKQLAYTGADLPLTAGAALLLLGAAAGITRRRRKHSA